MKFEAFNLTAQGASHIKKNRECQDASKSFFCEDYGIAVVCDGHGGDNYIRSAVGSEKASEIALDNIKEFISQVDKDYLKRHFDTLICSLEGSIITMWRSQIRKHWDNNPISKEEEERLSDKAKKRYLVNNSISSAYGTTLIAVVVTREYWFCFQVGDGKCVWIDKDSVFDQLKLDDRCFLNATTSLCDSDALEHCHSYYSEEIPAAVFVGSDGIDDCFKNNEQLYNFYKTICYSFGTTDFDKAVAELDEFLPRLSKMGSGDDVSIAAVLDMSLLPSIKAVAGFNREDERAKKQKAEEAAAKRNAELREEYERKALEISKKLENEKRMAEEAQERQNAIRLRQQVANDEAKIAKAIQDLENARILLNDAKIKLDKAEEQRDLALRNLQATTNANSCNVTETEHKELCKIYSTNNDIYLKYYLNHQNAFGKFQQAKIAHDSIIRSLGAKCPNPMCNKINVASAKYCCECGTCMSDDPAKFKNIEKLDAEDNKVCREDGVNDLAKEDNSIIGKDINDCKENTIIQSSSQTKPQENIDNSEENQITDNEGLGNVINGDQQPSSHEGETENLKEYIEK